MFKKPSAHTELQCQGCMAMQFGHLFAKGETREAAIRAMVVALKEVKIRGEIRTIVDYASEMVQSPDFVGNNIHTGWLDARIASQVMQGWKENPYKLPATTSQGIYSLARGLEYKSSAISAGHLSRLGLSHSGCSLEVVPQAPMSSYWSVNGAGEGRAANLVSGGHCRRCAEDLGLHQCWCS